MKNNNSLQGVSEAKGRRDFGKKAAAVKSREKEKGNLLTSWSLGKGKV